MLNLLIINANSPDGTQTIHVTVIQPKSPEHHQGHYWCETLREVNAVDDVCRRADGKRNSKGANTVL